ncbi:hypothetical protein C7212DRAFT_346212 [Tuber magnatum]|uniref:Uncharacterized protein n=1 Tax=Tuber magnatum TaxID=42249 RepID=A0A317SK57_9PEZI|nr:hypothetical protein C7212DRAFT_346212 [Tuber magnatum]
MAPPSEDAVTSPLVEAILESSLPGDIVLSPVFISSRVAMSAQCDNRGGSPPGHYSVIAFIRREKWVWSEHRFDAAFPHLCSSTRYIVKPLGTFAGSLRAAGTVLSPDRRSARRPAGGVGGTMVAWPNFGSLVGHPARVSEYRFKEYKQYAELAVPG